MSRSPGSYAIWARSPSRNVAGVARMWAGILLEWSRGGQSLPAFRDLCVGDVACPWHLSVVWFCRLSEKIHDDRRCSSSIGSWWRGMMSLSPVRELADSGCRIGLVQRASRTGHGNDPARPDQFDRPHQKIVLHQRTGQSPVVNGIITKRHVADDEVKVASA